MTFKKIISASASLGALLLASPALAVPPGTSPQTPPSYYTATTQGGMIGDGATDNATALPTACAYAETNNRTLFIPDGVYNVSADTECDSNVLMTPNAILVATTPGQAAVVHVGNTSKIVKDKRWEGGVFDAHNNAVDGFVVRYAYHLDVIDPYVTNQTRYAFNIGDPGTSTSSYEVMLRNVHVHRANDYWDSGLSCTVPSGSVGVYWGNATDSRLIKGEIVSQDIGVWSTKSSIVIDTVHPWPRASCGKMSVAFKDSAVGNTYIADHADTPSQYGWWFNSTTPQSALVSPRFTMNDTTITSAIGIYYSQIAYPTNSIYDAQFGDASSGGWFLRDFQTTIGGATRLATITGTHYSPTTSVNQSKFLANNNVPGFSPTCVHGATVTTVLFGSGASTWTAPSCFTSLTKIEAIGAGGSVAAGNVIGGAGGGAYSAIATDANFVANATLNFQLGLGGGTQGTGAGASGTADTWFDSNMTLLAQGGQSTATATAGNGGAILSSVGTTMYAGGAGGGSFSGGGGGGGAANAGGVGGTAGAGASGKGAGGGGSAGSTGAGANGGSGSTGIGGTAGTGGGAIGGQGWQASGTPATAGFTGTTYTITTYGGLFGSGSGGGGGGGGSGNASGNGALCGGGAGGSGTLGSGSVVRNGGNGCIAITYVQ